MKTIYKYELPVEIAVCHTVRMPAGAIILSVRSQHDILCLWALVNTDNDMENRFFHIIPTGFNIDYLEDKTLVFLDTALLLNGNLVFHIFEEA